MPRSLDQRLIQGECVPTSRTTRLDSKPFIVRPIADIVVATVKVSTVIDDWDEAQRVPGIQTNAVARRNFLVRFVISVPRPSPLRIARSIF